jgi:sugar lactone lactonase YvrE
LILRRLNLKSTWTIALSLSLVLILVVSPRALAFANGEAATIAIGQASLTSFNPAVSQTALVSPVGITFDTHGNLWVADPGANRVLEYNAPLATHEGASLVIGQTSFTARDAATSSTGLNAPDGVAFDPGGNLWVVDTNNNRVLEYTAPFASGEAASVVIGEPDFTSSSSATTAAGLNQPEALAFDSSGNLWVADALNSRVLEYTSPFSTGESATLVIGEKDFVTAIDQVTKAGMSTPSGLAFDHTGNLWVADGVRVLEYPAPFTTHEPANIVVGQNTFTNSSTVTDARGLDLPWAVAVDSGDNLWVADYGNNRVLEYTAPVVTDEAASVVVGQSNFTSSSQNPVLSPTASSLNHPFGVAFDSSGDLLISDYGQGRVLGYGTGFAAATTSTSTTSSASLTKTTTTVTTTGTGSTSSSGGGVPAFPYQATAAAVLTVLVAGSYLLVRRMSSRSPPGKGPGHTNLV